MKTNQTINRCIRNLLSIVLIVLFLVAGVATTTKEGSENAERICEGVRETERYAKKVKEETERRLLEEQKNSQNAEGNSTEGSTESSSLGENDETIESNN